MLSDETIASPEPVFGVSDAVAVFNQIFETATPQISIIGEIANYKVSQNKWVYFDIKDDKASIGCFMSVFNLHSVIESGMQVQVAARPGLTRWGKFSLTVQSVRPIGEGSIRRSFEMLRAKLDEEGLFAEERKRPLPEMPQRIGVISSVQAAGYIDFIEILSQRMGGITIEVANVQVQGDGSAEQIMNAIDYFNSLSPALDVVALVRGGGSRDDLVSFDDERLVRKIAGSRIPIITGVGHEIDVTLADLAADRRAATPSNAAQILVPDRQEIANSTEFSLRQMSVRYEAKLLRYKDSVEADVANMGLKLSQIEKDLFSQFTRQSQILRQLNPKLVLRRGYSIVRDAKGAVIRDDAVNGEILTIESDKLLIKAEVKNVERR